MQYFFLGRFLSKEDPANRNVIQRMCDAIYKPSNYLTLLFTIHHAIGFEIIDDILLRTMYTLDDVQPAQLNHEETRRFQDTVYGLPESILSSDSVDSQRQRERTVRDNAAEWSSDQFDEDWSGVYEEVNDCYRVLKNNEIMGQILRNKYGTMTKRRIEEVIEIMTDGGLRLINSVLKNEEEIVAFAQYEKAKNPDHDFEKIKRAVEVLSLIWTWTNIELVVRSINVPEIRASIDNVVKRAKTPAYDVIGYFTLLDTAPTLTDSVKAELSGLLDKYEKDPFVKRILSIRTQYYMNTHHNRANMEQSICSLLGIKYLPRPVKNQ